MHNELNCSSGIRVFSSFSWRGLCAPNYFIQTRIINALEAEQVQLPLISKPKPLYNVYWFSSLIRENLTTTIII